MKGMPPDHKGVGADSGQDHSRTLAALGRRGVRTGKWRPQTGVSSQLRGRLNHEGHESGLCAWLGE